MRELNLAFAWASALVDELARAGVRHAVVSPGSRSAPLALALHAHDEIEFRSILDERSAAFFALGQARASGAPVALVCTSGTAAANWLPAVVEAHYGRVPLLLLSADRPPELRGCGTGQTIDQLGLYGGYVRSFAELPVPEAALLGRLRSLTCRAVAASTGPVAGPVHLNVPLREPLAPIAVQADQLALAEAEARGLTGRESGPWTASAPSACARISDADLRKLAERIAAQPRGWVVCGPMNVAPKDATPIAELAARAGWPLLAEPLSQLRCGSHVGQVLVDAHDALLRDVESAARELPRVVLRFGAAPTSKAFGTLLEQHPEIEQIVIDADGWSDPSGAAADLVRAEPLALARGLVQALRAGPRGSEFRKTWIEAGRRARRRLDAELEGRSALSEPGVVRTLASVVPERASVFCASSMPVRDVDLFWPAAARGPRFFANRGANGIDGTLSCALGVASMDAEPSVLLCGDLALLHDASALVYAARSGIDLTVVVIDNDGGGIFEMLPVATTAPRAAFEDCCATPHGLDLAEVVRGFGLPCTEASDDKDLRASLERAFAAGGVQLVIARTDRRENAALHRALLRAVAETLAGGAPG